MADGTEIECMCESVNYLIDDIVRCADAFGLSRNDLLKVMAMQMSRITLKEKSEEIYEKK